MTEIDTAALRKLLDVMPGGTWTVNPDNGVWLIRADGEEIGEFLDKDEALAIVALRNGVLGLLDANDKLTADLTEVRGVANMNWDASTHHYNNWVHAETEIKRLSGELEAARAELAKGVRVVVVSDLIRGRVQSITNDNEYARQQVRELVAKHGGNNLAATMTVDVVYPRAAAPTSGDATPRQCPNEYTRPGGRQRGDRIVRCHLPAGHSGEHEEAETECTWLNDADAVAGTGRQPAATISTALGDDWSQLLNDAAAVPPAGDETTGADVEPPCHCPDAFVANGVSVPYCLRHGTGSEVPS